MAIKLIFSIIVIKNSEVTSRFPGGWDAWLKFNNDKLDMYWFDEHLFARASMNPSVIEKIIRKWEEVGFKGLIIDSGEKVWVDFCIPEGNERCDWIDYLETPSSVFLSGTEPGIVCYPKGLERKCELINIPPKLNDTNRRPYGKRLGLLKAFKNCRG